MADRDIHAEIPTDDEWELMVDECADLLKLLVDHGPLMRRIAKDRGATGYPMSSMGGASGKGGISDPSGSAAVANVTALTKNPIAKHARWMEHEVVDARNRLRTAVDEIRKAVPTVLPEPVREVARPAV